MTAPPAPSGDGLEGWHRLHPLSPLIRGGRALILLLVLAIPRLLTSHRDLAGLLVDAAGVGIALLAGVVSWLVTRWRVEGADLRIETGLLRRSSQRYPLRQVQAIDVVQTGLARVLGLAELRLRMAGGSGKGRLACLPNADARALREQLLALPAHAGATTAGTAPAGAAPAATAPAATAPAATASAATAAPGEAGALVLRVAAGRLVASLLLSVSGLFAALYLTAVLVTAVFSPAAAGALVGSGAVFLIGLGTALWRRFNGEFHLTVLRSGRGLELRSGLIQTTTELLPPGRVQALRVVEPLLWRPFGWCRVEAAVAGKRSRQEDGAQGSRRRALLPVGSYAQAYQVMGLVLQDLAVTQVKAPGRARWKAPLSYHRLSVGRNASCVATCSGRLRRVSHWVPLEKVQSIRRTQGPVQRRLRLATVHLDTAGPRMRAALRDRDVHEADEEVTQLPALCAAARLRAASG